MIDRRKFISQITIASGGIYASSTLSAAPESVYTPTKRPPFQRFAAVVEQAPAVALPGRLRIPLSKTAFPVSAQEPVVLRFPTLKNGPGSYALRLAAAIDFRDEKAVQVALADTGQGIGVLDLRYSHPFQPFALPIDKKWIELIRQQGLSLTLSKGNDAWFLRPEPGMDQFAGLKPQLLLSTSPGTEPVFLENLYSMNAFSPFGWQGGCVMDGLLELGRAGDANARTSLTNYLNLFLDDQKGIIYENPMTVPIDGSFNSIEDFLPFACITDQYPAHSSIPKAVDYLLARKNVDGLISSGDITTEGCYTVAYPLAAIAKTTHDAQLAQIALDQISHRMRFLTDERAIYQRSSQQGTKTYRNWGRGVAWYMLGSAKTLHLLQEGGFNGLKGLEDVRQLFYKNMAWLADLQTKNGLWNGYVDRPETGIDTSATAGIAAAIAWGCSLGIVPETLMSRSYQAYEGLQTYLTADGFLTNVSQINRGGEDLQQSSYRVIAQFGMGLMGQLEATLDRNGSLHKIGGFGT